jgi:hypothetical protein
MLRKAHLDLLIYELTAQFLPLKRNRPVALVPAG